MTARNKYTNDMKCCLLIVHELSRLLDISSDYMFHTIVIRGSLHAIRAGTSPNWVPRSCVSFAAHFSNVRYLLRRSALWAAQWAFWLDVLSVAAGAGSEPRARDNERLRRCQSCPAPAPKRLRTVTVRRGARVTRSKYAAYNA